MSAVPRLHGQRRERHRAARAPDSRLGEPAPAGMPAEWDAREGRRQAERVVGQVKGVAARPAGHRRRPAARDARIEADVHEALILHAEHQQHEVESGERGEHARLPAKVRDMGRYGEIWGDMGRYGEMARLPAKMRPRDEGAAEDEVGCQHKYLLPHLQSTESSVGSVAWVVW